MSNAAPLSTEDVQHAHHLVDLLNTDQVSKAICALEDILDGAVFVSSLQEEDEEIGAEEEQSAGRGRSDVQKGRVFTMDEVLADHKLTRSDLEAAAVKHRAPNTSDPSHNA